jgi:hypothetical protein
MCDKGINFPSVSTIFRLDLELFRRYGTGTAYHSRAPGLVPGISWWGPCWSSF